MPVVHKDGHLQPRKLRTHRTSQSTLINMISSLRTVESKDLDLKIYILKPGKCRMKINNTDPNIHKLCGSREGVKIF